MSDLTVAKTILEQLGGNKFRVMVGAKNLVGSENSLSFKFMHNSSKSTICRVTLTPMDVYEVEFSHIRNYDKIVDKTFDNVYNDSLVEIFEDYTGLHTSL